MNKNGIYILNVLVFKSKYEFNYMILHSQEIFRILKCNIWFKYLMFLI